MLRSHPVTPRQERHEREPNDMSDAELRDEYAHLCRSNALLDEELAHLQLQTSLLGEESVRFQQSTEIEEEKLANQLLRRLHSEEREKRRYRDLIRHEETARQEIMDQIAHVRGEKTEVESQLASEQESLMRQLQRRLVEVVARKSEVERELLQERQRFLELLAVLVAQLKRDAPEAPAERPVSPQIPSDAADGGAESPSAHAAVIQMERQLTDMIRQHAEAAEATARHAEACAELRERLESIQQAAFLDRARAAKLREELCDAKRRLAELESRCRAASVSEDSLSLSSSSLTLASLRNMSLRDRTKEVLSAPIQRIPSSVHPSCDNSDGNEEARSLTSSLLRSPAAHASVMRTATITSTSTSGRRLEQQPSSSSDITPVRDG